MKIENFCVSYEKVEIIKSLSIEVDFPSIIAIVGNNGSGKSTFFNALRHRIPFTGSVFFEGKDFRRIESSFLGSNNSFSFPFLVSDFIRINSENDLGDSAFKFLIEHLKIQDLLYLNIESLSLGQLQKVLLAQTLIQTCDMVLLDEPETHLDIKSRKILAEVLKAFASAYKCPIWIISHDLELVENVADKMINFSKYPLELDFVNKERILWHRDFLTNQ